MVSGAQRPTREQLVGAFCEPASKMVSGAQRPTREQHPNSMPKTSGSLSASRSRSWTFPLLALSLVLVGAACAQILGVEEPVLTEPREAGTSGDGQLPTKDGDSLILPDGRCVGAGCPCTEDNQCEAAHPKCVEGRCVECTTTPDSCPFGQYCVGPALRDAGADARDADADAKDTGPVGPSADPGPDVVLNVCAPGCSSDTACSMISTAAPFCHPQRHQCVQCLKPSDCSNVNEACSPAGRCATKCNDASFVCPIAGQKCCAPFCVDVTSDIANCNGCGNACTGGATTCCNAQCKNPLTANDTCGVCGTACSGATTCKAGTCR